MLSLLSLLGTNKIIPKISFFAQPLTRFYMHRSVNSSTWRNVGESGEKWINPVDNFAAK